MNYSELQSKALGAAKDSGLIGPIGTIAIDAIEAGTKLARQEGYDAAGAGFVGADYAAEALSIAASAAGLVLGSAMVPVIGWFASAAVLIATTPMAKSSDQNLAGLPAYCASLAPEPVGTDQEGNFVPADLFFMPSHSDKRMPSVFACAVYSVYETTMPDKTAYVGEKTRRAMRLLRSAIMQSWKVQGSDGGTALWPIYCDMMSAIETADRRERFEKLRIKLYRAAGAYTQGTQSAEFEWYRGGAHGANKLNYALLVNTDNPLPIVRNLVENVGWLTYGSILCRASSLDPLYALDECVFNWRRDTDPYYQEGKSASLRTSVLKQLGVPPKLGWTRQQKSKLKKQLDAARKR